MKTGFVWHESYAWHDTGTQAGFIPGNGTSVQPDISNEDPETKRRLRNLLEMSGLWDKFEHIPPRPATEEDILRFHTPAYLKRVQDVSLSDGGEVGPLTVCSSGGYGIAMLAAGGVLAAVDAVLDGKVKNAYALVRPPGHHAMPDMGMGFCVFGNAAIAGKYALARKGLSRIAFVDWDVHHGNGTESAFWTDPSALTISIHQDRFFPPDRGLVSQMGEGAGKGYNINVPLPPGSGVGAYVAAYERVVVPALYRYKPDLIIVPSGFDAGGLDPLGRNMMHSDGYRKLTKLLMSAADDLCAGRIVMCHEGGYSRTSVPFYGLAVMETLSGLRAGIEDPFLDMVKGMGDQDLQPSQERAIDAAMELLSFVN